MAQYHITVNDELLHGLFTRSSGPCFLSKGNLHNNLDLTNFSCASVHSLCVFQHIHSYEFNFFH
ncbi:hypothetical protein PthstB1num2_30910 [Parageobacillus thermoglucosidasius]|nr:hypothetical protein PthstB1num2_30910 [Parageobacillus thermoglucosidasius]